MAVIVGEKWSPAYQRQSKDVGQILPPHASLSLQTIKTPRQRSIVKPLIKLKLMAVFTLITSITRTESGRLGMKYPPLIYSYSAEMNIQLLTNYSIYLAALPDLKQPISIVSPVHSSSPKTRVQYENEMVLHKICDICG